MLGDSWNSWVLRVGVGCISTLASAYGIYKSFFPWLKYDLPVVGVIFRFIKARIKFYNTPLIIDRFENSVRKNPTKTLIIFRDERYSYQYVDKMATRVANVATSLGIRSKTPVALMMHNRPEFVWTFLGFQKLGASVAFINPNLTGQALLQILSSIQTKCLIVGPEEPILDAVEEILMTVDDPLTVYVLGLDSDQSPPRGMESFDTLLRKVVPNQISPRERNAITLADTCCFSFTSGTTGIPKPIEFSHGRIFYISAFLSVFSGFGSSDILYIVTPFSHSTAFTCLRSTISYGATIVIRNVFSAPHFWEDCRRHKVTTIVYIGEIPRYLLNQPKTDQDSVHCIKTAVGFGLRKDIWSEFCSRFNLSPIDCYSSTEGLTHFMNLNHKPGAAGRNSFIWQLLAGTRREFVKFDYNTGQPTRDIAGRCVKVAFGEPGLLLVAIPRDKIGQYDDDAAKIKNNKVVRHVFKDGDAFVNSGDVFVVDSDYFVYFHDRIGDMFSSQDGESISTMEVSDVLSKIDFVNLACVYGVSCPDKGGQVSMAALTLKEGKSPDESDLKQIYGQVCENLPTFARPVYLRVMETESVTFGTLKQQKVDLVREGCNTALVKDPLFYFDEDMGTYSPLV